MNNSPDCIWRNGVVTRDAGYAVAVRVPSADSDNITFNDLGLRGGTAFEVWSDKATASFAIPVTNVVGLRSGEDVIRIYARRIVAFVQGKKLTKRTFVSLVRHSVRREAAKVFAGYAVAVTVYGATPNPATVRFATLFDLRVDIANARAKLLNTALALKHSAALFARLIDPFFHATDYRETRVSMQGDSA